MHREGEEAPPGGPGRVASSSRRAGRGRKVIPEGREGQEALTEGQKDWEVLLKGRIEL